MTPVTRQNLSVAIAQLMPRIIQGVQLEFLVTRTITYTQFLILVAIHSLKSCSMGMLAKSMHVSMPTISGIVDRLVTAGYLARVNNPTDRRQVVVGLSKEGKKFIAQFQGVVARRWEEVLKHLNQDETESFGRIIQKIASTLQEKEK